MTHAWTHAWCKSPARDEAVRAAEDGRTAPLPTLEECIDRQKQTARPCGGTDPAPSRGERGAADTGIRTERITLEVTHDLDARLSDWIVEVVDESLGMMESVRVVEDGVHGWKDMAASLSADVLKLTAERDAAIRERDEAIAESERLRAERNAAINCVDEVNKSADAEVERLRTALADAIRRPMGVIPDSADGLVTQKELDEAEIRRPRNIPRTVLVEQLTDERDAAIRERDELRLLRIETETYRDFAIREKDAAIFHITELRTERDAARARVAELERQIGHADAEDADTGYALRLFVDGRRVLSHELGPTQAGAFLIAADHLAKYLREEYRPITDATNGSVAELEAASGGGEPVAWMVEWTDHAELYGSKTQAERAADGDVVPQPLYRSPPQPRGWLTGEEREAVETARDHFDDDDHGDSECVFIARMLKQILARSTPPEVVLDAFPTDETGELFSRRDVIKALAAAGVAVKEVGK